MVASTDSRDLVELAGLVATHARLLIFDRPQISSAAIEDYWSASQQRLARWQRSLRAFQLHMQESEGTSATEQWPGIVPVIHEVLTSEILARLWCATLAAYEKYHGSGGAELLARSSLLGHMEVRCRVLRLILQSPTSDESLNQFRSRCERWTDLLVGHLLPIDDVMHYAHNPDRARDFGDSVRFAQKNHAGEQRDQITLGSLEASFRTGLEQTHSNCDLHTRIAASVIACFPAEAFEASDSFFCLWQQRVEHATSDAQELIDQLAKLEDL